MTVWIVLEQASLAFGVPASIHSVWATEELARERVAEMPRRVFIVEEFEVQ